MFTQKSISAVIVAAVFALLFLPGFDDFIVSIWKFFFGDN